MKKRDESSENTRSSNTMLPFINKILIKDICFRSQKKYLVTIAEKDFQCKDIENTLEKSLEVVCREPLLETFYNMFIQEKALKLKLPRI